VPADDIYLLDKSSLAIVSAFAVHLASGGQRLRR
jgi:hypothetical protein